MSEFQVSYLLTTCCCAGHRFLSLNFLTSNDCEGEMRIRDVQTLAVSLQGVLKVASVMHCRPRAYSFAV